MVSKTKTDKSHYKYLNGRIRKLIRKKDKLYKKIIKVYTDGSLGHDTKAGGWACLIRRDGVNMTMCGSESDTSVERMELKAITMALEAIEGRKQSVHLYCDAQYIVNNILGNLGKWANNLWMDSSGQYVENIDLWEKILLLNNLHNVKWIWVKAHSGDACNSIVDSLAVSERRKLENELRGIKHE